jgi:AcrR family transcriptional regulator
MEYNIKLILNPKLYLKDPEKSELGRNIIKYSIEIIDDIGYEQLTFKKLAKEINSTEASIYRYFENKHKLLIYVMDLYWGHICFQVISGIKNIENPKEQIHKIVDLLIWVEHQELYLGDINQKKIHNIAIAESSKTYLSKEVDELNKDMLFKPYKDLCKVIEDVFTAYNPSYKYPKSLASTLIETSHFQYHFMQHLPNLCDFSATKDLAKLEEYLNDLIFGALDYKRD